MPFDGFTTGALAQELIKELMGGRIDKIYQPESDEIVLNIRSLGKMKHLLLSANPSHARFQLTEKKAETPLTPPGFCMACRKHFSGGKVINVKQHHFDRILEIDVETLNELGDLVEKKMILEIMGKHSNLILVDENGRILECVRHVSPFMSSVRAVQPGMQYQLPSHNHKLDPRDYADPSGEEALDAALKGYNGELFTSFYQVFNGFSPFASREVIHLANERLAPKKLQDAVNEKDSYGLLSNVQQKAVREAFAGFLKEICAFEEARPCFLYLDGNGKPVEFSLIPYRCMDGVDRKEFAGLSELLDQFYDRTDTMDKMRQKSQDLRHLVNTNLDRARKKEILQRKQLDDTKDREKDRIMGDLITANVWQIEKGMSLAELPNYYEEGEPLVRVRLDVNLTPSQNAQKYYARYNKQKRTEEALTMQISQTEEEIAYLESIVTAIELADCERDVEDIRMELHEAGYIKKSGDKKKKNLAKSKPLSFVTSEGIQGMVGKNNIQNDQLTFKMADQEDEWFHAKDMPGSHVILKVAGLQFGRDYTEKSLLEAARQAAIHSKGAGSLKVPVDHARRVYVKKPAGANPGFVRYTHQQTLYVSGAEN